MEAPAGAALAAGPPPACVKYVKPAIIFVVRLQARARSPGDVQALGNYLLFQNAPPLLLDARVAEYMLAYSAAQFASYPGMEEVRWATKHCVGGEQGPVFRIVLKFGNFPTAEEYF
jgi:hypothetical protein